MDRLFHIAMVVAIATPIQFVAAATAIPFMDRLFHIAMVVAAATPIRFVAAAATATPFHRKALPYCDG